MKTGLILLMVGFHLIVFGQSIPDQKFYWYENDRCISNNSCIELFLKARHDPVINQFNQIEFDKFLGDLVSGLELNNRSKIVLKLKILFPVEDLVCLIKTGILGAELSEGQIQYLIDQFSTIDEISPGMLRGQEVNCIGVFISRN